MGQALQVFGSLLILIAFYAMQKGRLTSGSGLYQSLNLVGAGVLAVLAASARQPGFFLLEFCWALLAARALLAKWLSRAP